MINKNSVEIRKEWTPEKLAKLAKKKISAFSTGITDEDTANGTVKNIGRGFATLENKMRKEYDFTNAKPNPYLNKNH